MKRTKIVCTMGPNADKPGMMKSWIEAGMDVARFNFSHGSHEEHKGRMKALKKLRKEMKVPIAILLDTKGTGDPHRRPGKRAEGHPGGREEDRAHHGRGGGKQQQSLHYL